MAWTSERHHERHLWLHHALDELVADYLFHHQTATAMDVMTLPVQDLLTWAYQQARLATEPVGRTHRDGVLAYGLVDDTNQSILPAAIVPEFARAQAKVGIALVTDSPESLQSEPVLATIRAYAQARQVVVRVVRLVEVDTITQIRPE